MDVIQMIFKILLIADNMIPESPLPNAEWLLNGVYALVVTGEIPLEAVDYFGEILRWMV
jgi:hypothetical protein